MAINYKIGVNTTDAIRSINGLKAALGGLAAAFSIRGILQFGDAITNLKNKLSTLEPDAANVEKQFKAIAGIAVNARAPLEAVGELFFRISRSTRELGISQREAANITESLAKSMAMTGMTAAEAAGPLLQIGQALQSGRFAGDELRSVLEGMPIVTEALAKELNVTVGELRKLGSEGKITADVFVRAMRNAKESIDEAFIRTLPTVSQAFSVLQTNAALAFNEFEKNTGVGRSTAAVIEMIGFSLFELSRNIDAVIGPIKIFAQVVGSLLAISLVGRVLAILRTSLAGLAVAAKATKESFSFLFDVMKNFGAVVRQVSVGKLKLGEILTWLLTPITFLIEKFGALAAGIFAFLKIDEAFEWFKSLGDSTSESQKKLQDYRKRVLEFKDALSETEGPNKASAALEKEKARLLDDTITKLQQAARAYHDQARAQEENLRISNQLIGASDEQKRISQELLAAERAYASEAQRLTDEIAKAKRSQKEEEIASVPELIRQLDNLDKSYRQQVLTIRDLVVAQTELTNARKLHEFTISQEIDAQRELRKIQDDIAKMTMTDIEKKYYDISAAARESAKAAIEAEEARRGTPLSTAEIDAYYNAAYANVKRLQEALKQHNDENRKFSTGWKKAMKEYASEATNAAKQAESVFKKATQGMEDAIVNFAKTGKFNFRDFLNSILEDLLRSQVRQLMAGLFNMGGGGGRGGGSLFGGFFATGGMIPPGRFGVVGERGPELVEGPANVTPMGNTQITYNINAVDAMSFKQMIAADPSFLFAVTEQGRRTIPSSRR